MDEDLREEDEERRREEGARDRGRDRDRDGDGDRDRDRDREGEEWKTLSRMSSLPLVNTALRAYEHSKASSRVVKVRPPSLFSIPSRRHHSRIDRTATENARRCTNTTHGSHLTLTR